MSTAASPRRSRPSPAIVVMGVSGCGKTTVGRALADRLGLPFVEGDELHPQANIDKMSAGIPLTDDDRWPWLAAIGAAIRATTLSNGGAVASCSALRRVYRERLAAAAGMPLFFILLDGHRTTLLTRLAERKDHFMPASLLDSQLATLERPAADEAAIAVSIEDDPATMLAAIEAALPSH